MKLAYYLILNQESSETMDITATLHLNPKILSITGMNKNSDVGEELSINQETAYGTLLETTTCGLTSYQYLIKNSKFLTLPKYGMHSITWPSMNYWQSSTLSM